MMRLVVFCPALVGAGLQAQHILHYTETSGYDHGTRGVSLAMFQSICAGIGCTVADDGDGSSFTPEGLAQFDAVIFSNTSGSDLLDPQQRAHFEQWVQNGGHVMGIHAASDTYRHSTANGGNTGTWDFYAELIGASVQENPNHVDGTPAYELSHVGTHASTANLPDPWLKHEEYYYWQGGYFGPDNHVVLEVEETVGPNGLVNSYDALRPMSWYRVLSGGSRVFYTALGHAASNYTDDVLFRQHVRDALVWLVGSTTGIGGITPCPDLITYPNPASDMITIASMPDLHGTELEMLDMHGRVLLQTRIQPGQNDLQIHDLPAGFYTVRVGHTVVRVCVQR